MTSSDSLGGLRSGVGPKTLSQGSTPGSAVDSDLDQSVQSLIDRVQKGLKVGFTEALLIYVMDSNETGHEKGGAHVLIAAVGLPLLEWPQNVYVSERLRSI